MWISAVRSIVLAAVVALLVVVAVIAVLATREPGIGEAPATAAPSGQSVAATQSDSVAAETEPLTLSLSAPALCETEAGRRGTAGLYGVGETPVKWTVTGGTGPYTLEIDGEVRDARHEYLGAKGSASVSCALETGNVYFGPDTPGREVRRYRGNTVVDSGPKTIQAVVTDAQGVTAEASLDIHVILVNPNVLKRGETYRVWGRLFTAPLTHDLHTSVYVEHECDATSSQRCETEIGFAIDQDGVRANLMLWESDLAESRRWQILSDGTVIEGRNPQPADAARGDPVDRAFDAVLESKGKPPAAARSRSHTAGVTRPPAAAPGLALSLSLSAPAFCETEAGRRGTAGLYGVAETPVKWIVTGGTGPYTLEIDDETRDARHYYAGAEGIASVSCALETANVYLGPDTPGRKVRRYRGKTVVDSGLKTIHAVVTDANGNMAEATMEVYVILSTGDHDHLLRGGRTYRVFGTLLTIPSGIDMRIGARETSHSHHTPQAFDVEGTKPTARLWVYLPSFEVIDYVIPDAIEGDHADIDLKAKFDELVESFGKLPQ